MSKEAKPVTPAIVPPARHAQPTARGTASRIEPPAAPKPADPNAPPTNSDITSESNYNQAKTPQEHRESQRRATDEAAQQQKDHPGGLPLPTSGQPVTRPEPDQQK